MDFFVSMDIFVSCLMLIIVPIATYFLLQRKPVEQPHIGVRFAASLLAKALIDNKLPRPDNWKECVVALSGSSTKRKTYNWYKKTYNYTHPNLSAILSRWYPDEFSYIKRNWFGIPIWNIFGCPQTGKDIDLIVPVTHAQKPLAAGEEQFLINVLWLFGYDTTKELDICYISNIGGTYQRTHGGAETIGIVYHTYDWHRQHHSKMFDLSEIEPLETSDKLTTISKFIMDKAETVMGKTEYVKIRQHKVDVYHSGSSRLEFTFELLKEFNMDPTTPDFLPSIWKSIVMKIVQCYLVSEYPDYHLQSYGYDKSTLARKFGEHYPQWEQTVSDVLLYRFKEPNEEFRGFLIGLYKELCKEHYPCFSEEYVDVVPKNPSKISDQLFQLFIESPNKMTDEFFDEWHAEFGETDSIGAQFAEECENLELLDDYDTLCDRILRCGQRTPEWMKAYHQDYKTGRSGGARTIPPEATPKEQMSLLYNLIMGCIGEQMIHEAVQENSTLIMGVEGCQFATVGMIVEGGLGSRGYCPDALCILPNGKIAVMEYKTIYLPNENGMGPVNNNCFLREYNLARLQMRGAVEVINIGSEQPLSTFGVAVFMFIYPTEDGIQYQLRWCRIDYL